MPRAWLWLAPASALAANVTHALYPREGGSKFKILQLADLHFGEDSGGDWGPRQDRKTLRAIEAVLDAEEPDLVVFSGDQLTGEGLTDSDTRIQQLDWLLTPLQARRLPWATVLGNHDACEQPGCRPWLGGSRSFLTTKRGPPSTTATTTLDRRKQYLDREKLFSYSRTGQEGMFRSDGGTLNNYHLKIYTSSQDVQRDRPSFLLWFMDTGGGSSPEALHPDQVRWLRDESTALEKKYGPLPGALYVHVPLAEYASVNPEGGQCAGASDDVVMALPKSSGSILGLLARANIGWVFAGHNHGNDWCCRTRVTTAKAAHDVQLCYGRHSGYGGYSTPGLLLRGARVLEIDLPAALRFVRKQDSWAGAKSWVRVEDGSVEWGSTAGEAF